MRRPSSGSQFGVVTALLRPARGTAVTLLVAIGTLALCASSAIHFYLWTLAYRDVATIGPLFLFQGSLAVALAVLCLVTRATLVIIVSAVLLASTIGGFVIATTAGLFGFSLHEVTGWAVWSLVAEGLGFSAFGAATLLTLRSPISNRVAHSSG